MPYHGQGHERGQVCFLQEPPLVDHTGNAAVLMEIITPLHT